MLQGNVIAKSSFQSTIHMIILILFCFFFIWQTKTLNRALDIGCAVGRSSFELAREFQEVIGIDYSQSFVDACDHMKNLGEKVYFIQEEGDLVTPLIAKVSSDIVSDAYRG